VAAAGTGTPMQPNCSVCGRTASLGQRSTQGDCYVIHWQGVCGSCVRALSRSFAGVTAALIDMNDEERARALDRLLNKLREVA
jgi:hypothetical protein